MKRTPNTPSSSAAPTNGDGEPEQAISVDATFQRATERHVLGHLAEAQALYHQVLQQMPAHADALHLLGVTYLQKGDFVAATDLIRRAIQVRPSASFYSNLGNALHACGKRSEAIASYRTALAIEGDLAEVLSNLGNVLLEQGKPGDVEEAVASCRRSVMLKPDLAQAHCNLGNALLRQGDLDDAVGCYQRALLIRPGMATAHSHLGHALRLQGRLDQAIDECQRAIQIQPGFAAAYDHLGDALCQKGLHGPAVECYQHALSLGADAAEAHRKLGHAYKLQGQVELSIGHYVEALKHSDRSQIRTEFVQSIKYAHFNDPHAEVRSLVLRALEDVWAHPGDLSTPAMSLIECHPAVQEAIARIGGAGPGKVGPPAWLDPSLLGEIAGDRLLLRFLEHDVVTSIALERLLLVARRQMLDEAVSGSGAAGSGAPAHLQGNLPSGALPAMFTFNCAIARQCFINEYVYVCSDDESLKLTQLQRQLDACLANGWTPDPLHLVAVASYAPLSGLDGAENWAALSWPAPLAALFTQQFHEPRIEGRLRGAIPRLTVVDSAASKAVRSQYEEHPYPRWIHAPAVAQASNINALLRRQFPFAPIPPLGSAGRLDVLVAGCGTGMHSILVAQQYQNAAVLAVDLSLSSLCYAKRKTVELGLRNVEYAQADLLHLHAMERRFDLIECVGVLHHLRDPVAGWKVLLGLLRPGGLMFLGLYSDLGRQDVVAARNRLCGNLLPIQAADIRLRRQEIMGEERTSEFEPFLSSRDFYATSACRDLLFHVQESRFTLPQLKAALTQLNLNLIGFMVEPEVSAAFARQFPDDPAMTNLEHWHAFETANPRTFSRMYQFWVQRSALPPRTVPNSA